MTVIDVNEATFSTEVIERSRSVAVVVDFWASWCAPCRALGPVLESAASAREGKAILAKLDTDANQGLAQTYGIQSIPAVKGFRDGAVVDEFVGVQPPGAVARFFDGLIPSEAAELVRDGNEPSLRRALELEPGRPDASVALARILLARGERQEALTLSENVAGSFQADGLAARIRLEAEIEDVPELAPTLRPAFDALDAGSSEMALDLLVKALADAGEHRESIRQVIVGELDVLGAASALARDTRRRLASVLY